MGKIRPKKAYYVTSKDETQILYDEWNWRKKDFDEKVLTIKGRLKVKPTIFNIIELIKEKAKCEHSFIDKDNEGNYGKEICRFCGEEKEK